MRTDDTLRVAGGPAAPRPGAPLRDGEYSCVISSGAFSRPNIVVMGRMDIRGQSYRYRPFGKVTQGFAPYSMGGDGTLRWGGRMSGLDAPPSMLIKSYRTPEGFIVQFRANPRAYVENLTCKPV